MESKAKSRPSFSDNSSKENGEQAEAGSNSQNTRDQSSSSSSHRVREGEWNHERPPFNGKNRDSRNNDQTPAQPTSFTTYNYTPAEHSYVDNNRRAVPMMCYNTMTPMTPWNQMDPMPMNPNPPAMPMPSGMDMVSAPNTAMNPYAFMGMPVEGMYGVVGIGNYNQYGMLAPPENMMFPPVKEVVHLSKSVLYPPNPNAPPPTTRGKPLGCKTVYVGGLPEQITEEIIKEIFDRCGTVETIRMSKKNFCHIRFTSEMFVENAIYYSGYRIKIENKDEPAFTGRLHVDYAQARDDQYDYECMQRALKRQARHQEQDYYRSVTPPIVHFTEHEAAVVVENLKNEEKFPVASQTVIAWLERGECTKRNAGVFYSILQSTSNRTRQIQTDKVKDEEVLNEAKKLMKQHADMHLSQLTLITKIHKAVSIQKNWDQFTKAQRKNIEAWRKQAEEMRNIQVEEVINEREDEEMELSEDENDEGEKKTVEPFTEQQKTKLEEEINKLRDECDSLKCQLDDRHNEVAALTSDYEEEIKRRENQLTTLRQVLQNTKREVLSLSRKHSSSELKEFRTLKRKRDGDDESNADFAPDGNEMVQGSSSSTVSVMEIEARLIGLISTFLHVHPFGANIDYICSYLHQIDSTITVREVENLMSRFPGIFREDSTGIGASLGKKWFFTGFQT